MCATHTTMPNTLLESSRGVVRNATKDLKTAGFVDLDSEGEPTRLAPTRVRAYDGLLVVLDRERVAAHEEADLDRVAAGGTDSAYQAINGSVQTSGNAGYKVQLPTAGDAGFQAGDSPRSTARQTAPGVLCIYRNRRFEVVDAVLTVREEQVQ